MFLSQPSYAGSRRELGKLQFAPGESPCVSHMAIYAGQSLAECSPPAAPLARYPTLHCMGLEVVRSRDRTIGLTLTLEPNTGEVGRSSFPSTGSLESIKVLQHEDRVSLHTSNARVKRRYLILF